MTLKYFVATALSDDEMKDPMYFTSLGVSKRVACATACNTYEEASSLIESIPIGDKSDFFIIVKEIGK